MARKLQSREKVLLTLLVLAGLGVLFWSYRGEGFIFGGSKPVQEEVKPYGEPPIVNMAQLEQGARDYDPSGRDLFKYYVPPPPVPAYRPPPPEPPPPPVDPPPRPAPSRPQPPTAPQPNFKYLGWLGPKENKIAVFGVGDEVVLARVGEIVQDRFRLLEFKHETVVMGYEEATFRGQTTELKIKSK